MAHADISNEVSVLAEKYQYHKPPDALVHVQELLRQLLQWLLEWLDTLSFKAPGQADSRPLSSLMIAGICLAGIVALVVIVYVTWRRAQRAKSEGQALKKGAVAIEKILDSAGLKNEAQSYAGRNNFKSACRSLYLSLLQLLHEREIAIFAPAKTNYEYAYLLAPHPELQAEFKQIAGVVELVWFGSKIADQNDYQECCVVLEKLEAQTEKIYARKKAAALEAANEAL